MLALRIEAALQLLELTAELVEPLGCVLLILEAEGVAWIALRDVRLRSRLDSDGVEHLLIVGLLGGIDSSHGRSWLLHARQAARSGNREAWRRRPRNRFERPDDARRCRRNDRLRQDRPRDRSARGGASGGHSDADHRPQGRHGKPGAHVSGARWRELRSLGQHFGRTGGRAHARGVRREDRGIVEGRARRAGDRTRAHPEVEGCSGCDHLHAGLVGRGAAQRDRLAWRSPALVGDRGRNAPGRDRGHRHKPPRPCGSHGRPALEPRARAPVEPDRKRLAGGEEP